MNLSQSNSTGEQIPVKCVRDTSVTAVVFPILYSLLFVAALVLNILAAWIFFQIPNTSTFVVYLKNVVVADLLMTVTILIKVVSDSDAGSWQLKAFTCRFSAVLFYMTMYMSILLLGLISLDRYLKIVRPFGKTCMQKVAFGKAAAIAMWGVMFFVTALPNMILTDREPAHTTKLKCSSLKGPLGMKWHMVTNHFCQFVFWCTFTLMAFCYTFISKKVYESYQNSRSKSKATSQKTKAKVFVVVAVFFVCFAPFHFTRIPYTMSQTGSVDNCRMQQALYIAKETTLWLSATNTCLDPLIYIFLCRIFRKKLADALRLKSKCLPIEDSESTVETSTKMDTTPL
ncbi:P2Y13 protein, partial [Amia calva]|nr:P2Y13 protein [Amia calva]